MDPELDREIAEHVLRMHRYRNPGEQEGDGEKMAAAATSSATISDSRRRANKYFASGSEPGLRDNFTVD